MATHPLVPRGSRRNLAVLVSIAAAVYGLYFVHLRADFPNGSPWNDWAKYTDEGWYGGAALHAGQGRGWYTPDGFNPAVALPLWPLLLRAWFAIAGAGMAPARALAVALFGGSLLLLFALLRRYTGSVIAISAVLLALLNPYSFAFGRLAILEPLEVCLLLLAFWTATQTRRSTWWSAPCCGLLLALLVLTKTTAVVLAPAVLYLLGTSVHLRNQARPLRADEPLLLTDWQAAARDRRALRACAMAIAVAVAIWAVSFAGFVRPHYLQDYRHLFAVNAGKAHGRNLLPMLARALGNALWIDRILIPLAFAGVAASFRWMRELWRVPLFGAAVLALAGSLGFIGYHTWFQPRYYLVCVLPLLIVLALATHALARRAEANSAGALTRHTLTATILLLDIAAATMGLRTAHYLCTPRYTFLGAANSMASIIHADPAHSPILLAGSGDDIALFTGVRAANPEWPIGGLPALISSEQPGWYAAFRPVDDEHTRQMRAAYTMREVAHYSVMDDPDHRLLVLYRMDAAR